MSKKRPVPDTPGSPEAQSQYPYLCVLEKPAQADVVMPGLAICMAYKTMLMVTETCDQLSELFDTGEVLHMAPPEALPWHDTLMAHASRLKEARIDLASWFLPALEAREESNHGHGEWWLEQALADAKPGDAK